MCLLLLVYIHKGFIRTELHAIIILMFIKGFRCVVTYVSLCKRLKKFDVDEDEESLSNMDTECEVKPSSQLNQGTGSNLSDYISSVEKGRELGSLSFFHFFWTLYIYIAVADKNILLIIEKGL